MERLWDRINRNVNSIAVNNLSEFETEKVLTLEEGHFTDLKAVDISPARITRTLAAFSNAEGGEVYIGIDEDKQKNTRAWRGFANTEAANGHIQIFEELFPLGRDYSYDFLRSSLGSGLVLKVEVKKTREIKKASNDKVYVRRGAMNLPVISEQDLSRLRGSASRRVADVTISYRAAVQSDGAPPSAKSCQPTGGSSNGFQITKERDEIYCGEGKDQYMADKLDYVDSSCEVGGRGGGGANA